MGSSGEVVVAGPSPVPRGWARDLPTSTLGPVSPMPEPGDVSPGFIAEANRSQRMVYDHNFQATHCAEAPAWTGRWRSPRGDRWWVGVGVPGPPRGSDGAAGVRPAALTMARHVSLCRLWRRPDFTLPPYESGTTGLGLLPQ